MDDGTSFNATNGDDMDPMNHQALAIGTVMTMKSILQAALLLTAGIGLASMIYLHSNKRLRARVHGPLATGVNNLVLYVSGIAMVVVVLFQFLAISVHGAPCVIHGALTTAVMPICGAAFLLRAWVLVVQFARVQEQLRWLKLYQMSPKDRAEHEQRPLPLSARVDLWISTHRFLSSPYLLVSATVLFGMIVWIPSVMIEAQHACDHDLANQWDDTNVWLFFGLAMILSTKLRGKLDTIGIQTELKLSAVVLVGLQMLQLLNEFFERRTTFDPNLDGDALEDQYDVEVAFSFWYSHSLHVLQLLLLVVLVAVRPAVRLRWRRVGFSGALSAEQKLHQILNDRHLKEDFQEFLQREVSVENLTFYDSIKTLVKKSLSVFGTPDIDSVQLLENRILEVYGDFIVESGRFQVNLPNADRLAIQKAIDELHRCPEPTLDQQISLLKACMAGLNQAQATIFHLMAADSLQRFLRDRDEDLTIKSGYAMPKSTVSSQVPVTAKTMDSVAGLSMPRPT